MIAVVTGGSGFIGSHLVQRLLAEGWQVRCLARPGGGAAPAGAASRTVALEDASAIAGCDWLDDADVVFHLAGRTRAVRAAEFISANVNTTGNLLAAVARRNPAARFVHVSSQAAAGPARALDRPVTEDDAPAPVEAYGRSKLAAERVVASFAARLPVTIVRPAAIFGPRDRDFLVLFRMAQRGLVLHPANGSQWISVGYVGDVVEVLLRAAQHGAAVNRTYFVAGQGAITWRMLASAIGEVIGRGIRQVDLPRPLVWLGAAFGDVWGMLRGRAPLANTHKAALARPRYWVCSQARAEEELGLGPSRSLPEGLADTYYWYVQQGWMRAHAPAEAAPA